jgi:hypothetical protein
VRAQTYRPGTHLDTRPKRIVSFGTVQAAIAAGYSPLIVYSRCEALGLDIIPNGPFRGRMYKRNELGQRQRVVLTLKPKAKPEAPSPTQETSDAIEHPE